MNVPPWDRARYEWVKLVEYIVGKCLLLITHPRMGEHEDRRADHVAIADITSKSPAAVIVITPIQLNLIDPENFVTIAATMMML